MNWAQLVGDRDRLRELLEAAYKYNMWKTPEDFAE
jgi:hypothetical protein